jgi:hypothetical protein
MSPFQDSSGIYRLIPNLLVLLATATVARFCYKLYVARRKFWHLQKRGLVCI